MINSLKYQFPNINLMDQSYSQVGQDLFVLSILKGKINGRYVEIGGNHPIEINNTYLLEKKYNWAGVSLDSAQWCVDKFNESRNNPILLQDAVTANYSEIFTNLGWTNKIIDYASVDIEPSISTYHALVRLLESNFKCAVITFEHANYQDQDGAREQSREYLTGLGYDLLVPNVQILIDKYEFEDWWVNPELVDMKHAEKFRYKSDQGIFWKDYLFKEWN